MLSNMKLIYTLLILSTIVGHASSWSSSSNVNSFTSIRSIGRNSPTDLNVLKSPKEDNAIESAEETTEKYGLEAGLFQSLKSNDGESAKSLLSKYGIAYLATSIPLAIVSFSICYVLVDNGVDVTGLLSKVGINAGDTGDKVGTFAIAYAAHKAASPIRFPPTVILTPVVAKLIGKEVEEVDE